MKKGLYKFILSFVVIISAITFIAPFSINAQYLDLGPFVGFNFYIENYDNEYNISLQNGTGTLSINKSDGQSGISLGPAGTVGGQTFYSTGANGGGLNLEGDITLNQSSTSTQYVKRVIHVDIILNDNYIGYFVPIVYYGMEEVFRSQYSVNGNIISFSFVDNNVSNTNIQPYNLQTGAYHLIKNNKNERWSFPLESFNVAKFGFDNLSLRGINNTNDYIFPIFNVTKNTVIYSDYTINATQKFVFYTNKNIYNLETFKRYFSCDKGSFDYFDFYSRFNSSEGMFYLLSVDWKNDGSNGIVKFSYIGNDNIFYMPIYYGKKNNDRVSTDFALQFGLTNSMLENINIIANGNQASNNSSSHADNTNSQATQVFQQEEQIVNNAEQNLQDNLDNLDIQNQNNNLFGNSKFIASANWVRTQFNTLTNNNAFGYLITFSLVIGLALVIIGKLRG